MKNEKILIKANPDLRELIPGYLKHRKNDLRLIAEYLEKEDYESLRILGHSMRGSGSGYGFDDISDIGSVIELAATKKNPAEISKKAEELEDYLSMVEVIYK